METKLCKKCGRELPLSEFYSSNKAKDGLQSYCKECQKECSRISHNRSRSTSVLLPEPDLYFDERLKGITPRELIEELRQRGYTGDLEYRQVKIFKIKV